MKYQKALGDPATKSGNVLDSNANVGIGIGFRIIFVENKLKELGYI